MRLTPVERQREANTAAQARTDRAAGAAGWKAIGDTYADQDRQDCCYLCDAGRAYDRAAEDFTKAGMPKEAKAALAKAAKAYDRCGQRCNEAADMLCGQTGLSQARLIYERIEKAAKTAADAAGEAAAKAKREHLEREIILLREAIAKQEAERDKVFKKKTPP